MANYSVNPLTFQSMKIETAEEQSRFLYQLSTFLSQLSQTVVSGFASSAILSNQLFTVDGISTSATAVTVPCVNASIIVYTIDFTALAAATFTLTGVDSGVPIVIRAVNGSAGTLTFKLVASSPTLSCFSFSAGTSVNLTTTGVSMTTGQQRLFVGASNASSTILLTGN